MDWTDEDLIDGYLTNYAAVLANDQERQQETFWAFELLIELLSDDPERLWRITVAMIRRTVDENALCYIGAGPLEDLLASRGHRFIDRAEQQANDAPHFAWTLCAVWPRGHAEIVERVRAACKTFSRKAERISSRKRNPRQPKK